MRVARLEFNHLGVTGPVAFEGGVIFLEGYGCNHCGYGFWIELVEGERNPIKAHTSHPCPHCSVISMIPGRRHYGAQAS